MAEICLGFAVGAFMSAYINKKYNREKWISTKYVTVIGCLAFLASLVLFFMDL